jgi:SNF2 family DNA or RNA helicase
MYFQTVKNTTKKEIKSTDGRYIFRDTLFNELTYGSLLKIADAAVIQFAPSNPHAVQAVEMEVDACTFICNHGYQSEHHVSVVQTTNSVFLDCSCGNASQQLCMHQGFVLFHVMDNPNYRVFFDKPLRIKRLIDFARSYGIQDETTIVKSFQLNYEHQKTSVQLKIPELIGLTEERKLDLQNKLLPISFSPENNFTEKECRFLLLHTGTYSKEFVLKWTRAGMNKEGEPKNPIALLNALDEALVQTDPTLLKAFTALGLLQQEYRHKSGNPLQQEAAFQQEMKTILACFPLFEHYPIYEATDKQQALKVSNLQKIALHNKPIQLQLKVAQKDAFFEITGFLTVDNHVIDLNELRIDQQYFVRFRNNLYLIKQWNYLRTIHYFQQHHAKLIIHASQFEEFQLSFLGPLENAVSIDYAFIKPATRAIIKQTSLTTIQGERIYLTDSEHYIHITPVIQYGDMEMPVLSRRKLLTIDQTGNSFEIQRNEDRELRLLGAIIRLHSDFELQMGGDFFYLHKRQFLENNWFLDAFESWNEACIEIHGFQALTKLKLTQHSMKVTVQLISGIDWFETKTHIQVGNQRVRLKEIQKSILQKNRYVQLGNGELALLPQKWLDRFAAYFRSGELWEEEIRIPKTAYQFIDEWFDAAEIDTSVRTEIDRFKEKINHFERIPEVELPLFLNATLRHYQRDGYHWLHFLDDFGFGGILADDMGLGKTLQILAYLTKLQEQPNSGTHLIVVPTSLVFNWQDEIAKFSPHLRVLEVHGNKRIKSISHFNQVDIVLTTYGTLLADIKHFRDFKFNVAILDEGQTIKNPDSKRYKAVRFIQARQRLVLTGTPIENNTLDIYALLSFCNPGMFGSIKQFRDHYAHPIDKFQDSKRARELQRKINPFLLRRTKKQVATELPEKTEMVVYCEMDHEQQRVYDVYKTELKEYLTNQRVLDDGENSMHVLQALTKLRQICNSPALLNENGVSYGNQSAKIDELMEQLANKTPFHKVLVFSQFVGMLDLIKAALDEQKIAYSYLTGQTKNRKEVVRQFQEDEQIRIFLISLKAGGMGLNLTQADYVYLVDPWWNPATENQAIDRVYRIGQSKKVVAIRLITPNSIEEKIRVLQERKHELANDLVHTDTAIMKKLSKKELMDLL